MRDLIVYFSWSGHTASLVEGINSTLGYDLVRIFRATPYSTDYRQCAYVEAKEEIRSHILPEITPPFTDVSGYDRILLFFPVWWYTMPMPIATFVSGLRGFRGEVVVFANSYTNDPLYMSNIMRDLRSLNNSVKYKQGLFNKSVSEHIAFLRR